MSMGEGKDGGWENLKNFLNHVQASEEKYDVYFFL